MKRTVSLGIVIAMVTVTVFVSCQKNQNYPKEVDSQKNTNTVEKSGITVAPNGTIPEPIYTFPAGQQEHGIFTMVIEFSVIAFGKTQYIPTTANSTVKATQFPHAIQYAIDSTNGAAIKNISTGIITYIGIDSVIKTNQGNYVIPVGKTMKFQLVVTFQPKAFGQYRMELLNVPWNVFNSSRIYCSYNGDLGLFKTPFAVGQ